MMNNKISIFIEKKLSILLINTTDIGGGAERIVMNLYNQFQEHGIRSSLAVGNSNSEDRRIIRLNSTLFFDRCFFYLHKIMSKIFADVIPPLVTKMMSKCYRARRYLFFLCGRTPLTYPRSYRILNRIYNSYDIIHCHNLHGEYFDLRILPILSNKVVTVLTLHDMWMLTGHCAHSFSCDLWKTGCQRCPSPSTSPELRRRDSVTANYEIKKRVYAASKLHVITPSQWLMDKVYLSILKVSIISSEVIPNGVDIKIYHPPENKEKIRNVLGYSIGEFIILFTANGIRNNLWKDFLTMREAIKMLAQDTCLPIRFIALGDDGPPESLGSARIEFIPYIRDEALVARYFQSADLYIHAALADTFPTTILEAMACGLPVVATAVGGISEMVIPEKTGILVNPGDSHELCEGMERLVNDKALRIKMGEEGVKRVIKEFTLDQQVEKYLLFYERILSTL